MTIQLRPEDLVPWVLTNYELPCPSREGLPCRYGGVSGPEVLELLVHATLPALLPRALTWIAGPSTGDPPNGAQ